MQHGSLRKHHGAWTLFYYDSVFADGQRIRKKMSKKLADVSPEYPTKRSVLLLAEKILQPINAGTQVAESSLTVLNFVENVYLPHVKRELRASTYKDYNDIFRVHLKNRLGQTRLRDFRVVNGQRLMREITGIGHTSLLRVKSFLSGTFKHARRPCGWLMHVSHFTSKRRRPTAHNSRSSLPPALTRFAVRRLGS